MKVKSLSLRGYKRLDAAQHFDFFDQDTGRINNVTVLVGQNGSGKTTIMQAIASLLGTAVGKLKKPSQLNWPGYNYKLLNSGRNIEAQLTMLFDEEELEATDRLHQALNFNDSVGQAKEVALSLDYFKDKISALSNQTYAQFKGRHYAILYRDLEKQAWENFQRVGSVMWYTEQRTSTSISGENGEVPKNFNEETLRQRLADFHNFHVRYGSSLRQGQRDVFARLAQSFSDVFKAKELRGPDINFRTDFNKPPFFFLHDKLSKKGYELSEMSGGERAIFPILLDFAYWHVNKSVILIDELELHLHPPLQQAFLAALPLLGQDNQFIISTHSDYVASLVPESNIIRLD